MKTLTALTLAALLLVSAGAPLAGKNTKKKGVTNIKDVRATTKPGEDLIKYHHHDVDVFRTNDNTSSYRVYYYHKINDTLRCYQASCTNNYDLDRAAYKWLNDTLVAIRLYNAASGAEIKFKVFGNTRNGQKISGMMME